MEHGYHVIATQKNQIFIDFLFDQGSRVGFEIKLSIFGQFHLAVIEVVNAYCPSRCDQVQSNLSLA